MEEEMCGTTAVKQNCLAIINEIFEVKNQIGEKLKPILIETPEETQVKTPEPNNSTLIKDLERLLRSMRRLSGEIDL